MPHQAIWAPMKTEGVELEFTEDAIEAIADIAVEVNTTSRFGARRLFTAMERILEDIPSTLPTSRREM